MVPMVCDDLELEVTLSSSYLLVPIANGSILKEEVIY